MPSACPRESASNRGFLENRARSASPNSFRVSSRRCSGECSAGYFQDPDGHLWEICDLCGLKGIATPFLEHFYF